LGEVSSFPAFLFGTRLCRLPFFWF
jgi:hypothetical protein